jgi:ornithine cyclodeaminase
MRLLCADELPGLLPMQNVMALMRDAFRLISGGGASVAHRQALELSSGTGLLMGAATAGEGIVAKLVSVMPSNRTAGLPGSIGLLLLMDADTGSPLALIDGTSLTAIRTAALNACAIALLSRPDSKVALLLGCGTQASAQLAALQAVCQLDEIRVMGRDAGRTREFVEARQSQCTPGLRACTDAQAATDGADIIIAATNSHNPVLPAQLVPAGCHVSGIGSYKPEMCEFDNELLSKSSIFVECRQTAMNEAGELIRANQAGVTAPEDWTEIGELLLAGRAGRQSSGEITFFKSVGHAVFDLLAARAAWQAAIEQDAGTEWISG